MNKLEYQYAYFFILLWPYHRKAKWVSLKIERVESLSRINRLVTFNQLVHAAKFATFYKGNHEKKSSEKSRGPLRSQGIR